MISKTSFNAVPETGFRIGRLALLALVYFGLGLAGLALAIPPGYASPIFPAAGFAVAIMLWSGQRAWLGIALGSFFLNLHTGSLAGAANATTVLTAMGIAVGAALHAQVAAKLVERVAGRRWQSMESARDIVLLLAVAGPISCLVSASVGVGTLYLNGLTPAADVLFTWWNWWAGDTLGVLVALPLALAWLLRANRPWRERLTSLWPPMIMALAVIVAGYVAVSQWEHTRREEAISQHGENLAKRLGQRFIAHQEALASLKRLMEVSPDMSYGQFDHFTRITLRENPDIFALSLNSYVRHSERSAIERRMARDTQTPDFHFKERDANKKLVPAGVRSEYVIVRYIAPLEGNLPAIGYDINSEPVRQDAIRRARATQRLSVTSTIHLVQENQKRIGALLLNPAYKTSAVNEMLTDNSLMGFAVGVVKLDQMVQIATDPVRVTGLAFQIDDVTGNQSSRVFQSENAGPINPQVVQFKTPLAMADRNWELSVYPTAEWQPANRPWIAWATGIMGLMLATLLQILLLVTTGQAAAAERRVRQQAVELKTQAAALLSRTELISTLFELSPDGFVAFAPDGMILFANPAFHAMTGLPPEIIVGHSLVNLDERLRECAERPERFTSIAAMFAEGDNKVTGNQTLALVRPRAVVLQMLGVHSNAASFDRFIYFRDVTRETEIDHMKSEFLSHAAHELRTPMASIYGFTELLMTREFDEETRRDLLTTIHRQTEWLVEIINELLDLARIEARRGKDFSIESVPLAPLVSAVISAMHQEGERWPVRVDLPVDLPAVRADAAKLRQALTNVLGNAVKYSPKGGTIEICGTTRDNPGKREVGIAITDYGIGMTAEQAGRVGERFYRADNSGKIPGTGLGMSIVKEIIELLGGSVSITSSPGAGTTVTLWLPVDGESKQRLDE